jgi:hypothetical protein
MKIHKYSRFGTVRKISKIILRKMIKCIVENMANTHEEMGHFKRVMKMS